MHALLLLAGRSTRFWPLAEKSLFSVAGKTLIEHQIDLLKASGIGSVSLIGGAHNMQAIKTLLPDIRVFEQENLDLGMQGALLSALPHMPDEPILVVSGNDLIETSGLLALIKTEKSEQDGALLCKRVSSYFPGGYVTLDRGRIVAISEKPGMGNEPSDLVTIVAHLHKHPKKLLEALSNISSAHDDGYERALDMLFRKLFYEAIPYEGLWQPVKYPWHLLPAQTMLLKTVKANVPRSAAIHKTAVLEGDIQLGENVKVMAHATIAGPCVIGDNSIIGNNTLIRQSSIGADCVIGFNTEVARSVLGNGVWAHSSYIGDSVLGDSVSLGAGSVTANLRLDEGTIQSKIGDGSVDTQLLKLGAAIGAGARLGVHTTVMPGIKIGKDCFIESSTYLTQDLPDKSFAKMKNGALDVRANTKTISLNKERKKIMEMTVDDCG